MTFIAMFDTASELAKFLARPQLVQFTNNIGEWLGSFAAEFTLDGATSDEIECRVRQFNGTLVRPCE